jgi:twitching motility protein PilT
MTQPAQSPPAAAERPVQVPPHSPPVSAPPGTSHPQLAPEQLVRNLPALLEATIHFKASDLHLQADSPPTVRIDGVLHPLNLPILTSQVIDELVAQAITPAEMAKLEEKRALDTSMRKPGMGLFRLALFHEKGRKAAAFRAIPAEPPTLEQLNLPPVLGEIAELHRGLVLVTGTTGSGKTTTLAAMIRRLNEKFPYRIITVEDPIEYEHRDAKSLISQVEVGTDTESYEHALRAAMRQDPDVILIGEIRDTFSLVTALRAADTGHIVFSTVHATNAPMTIERVVALFDKAQSELMNTQLATNLICVFCQRLAKRRDGAGRVPVVEFMNMTPLARKYILDHEYDKLKNIVANRESGNQTFDQHLTELFQKQVIDVNEAKRLASNVDALNLALRGIGNSDNRLTQL